MIEKTIDFWCEKGKSQLDRKEYEESISSYKKAIRYTKNDNLRILLILRELAFGYHFIKDFEEATLVLERALIIAKNS